MNEHYRIDVFDQTTGFVHPANVREVSGGSRIEVKDPFKKTIRAGEIRGKYLPDRDGIEAKQFFVELRKIAGVPPKPRRTAKAGQGMSI